MSLDQNEFPEEELPDWLDGLSDEEGEQANDGDNSPVSDKEISSEEVDFASLEPSGTGELFDAASKEKASEYLGQQLIHQCPQSKHLDLLTTPNLLQDQDL